MSRSLAGFLVVGVTGLLGVTGCGSGDGPPAASGSSISSSSPSASASASASGTPASGFSVEAKDRATSATRKALLPSSAFGKIGLDVADKPKTGRWDWFDTCAPTLPSESRQVVGTNGTWDRRGLVVSQTVVAYPDGIAQDLVGEVERAVSCSTYDANGKTFSKVEAFDLDAVESADATFAWCMVDEDDTTLCHSVLAARDLVSSLWVASSKAQEARNGLEKLTALAAARIEAQVS